MSEIEKIDHEKLIGNLHRPFNGEYLIKTFEHLISELGPHMHEYDTIVGDDVSGRLLTLVIADLAGRKRKQMGLPPPQVFFINAGSNVSKSNKSGETLPKIRDLIKKHTGENRKILIVTEWTSTGDSIAILANEFKKQNFMPDLCILDSAMNPASIGSLVDFKIFLGAVRSGAGGCFYFRPYLSGLYSADCTPIAEKRRLDNSEKAEIIQARQDMKLIAGELWKIME